MDKTIPAGAAILLDFIGSKEAPKGHGTVFGNRKMPKPLTQMTFDEVVADGPRRTKQYGSSACGRYQFMRDTLDKPGTLADLKGELGLTGDELFDADLQDRLGFHLLKRRGYERFVAGKLSVEGFGLNLAKEWASFPVLKACKGAHRQVKRGETYYLGDGVNKVLATPEEIERVLAEVLAAEIPRIALAPKRKPRTVSPVPIAAAAPRVQTVEPDGKAPGLFGAIWNKLRGRPALPAVPVIAGTKNDRTIFYVQKMLHERAYYVRGFVDGLDGKMTQDAVASARETLGLPREGGIDAAFLARLPSLPQMHVSKDRSEIGILGAAKHAPEASKPNFALGGIGLSMLGLGGADLAGIVGTVQSTASQAGDIMGTVQSALGIVGKAVALVFEHRSLVLILVGLWCAVMAFKWLLQLWIMVKQAFR